jgi:hypothetical protein
MYSASSIVVSVMRSVYLRMFPWLVTYRMQVSEATDSGECRSELQTNPEAQVKASSTTFYLYVRLYIPSIRSF